MRDALAAASPTPMAYLFGDGAMARTISPLLIGLLAVSVLVIVVISALVLIGTWRGRAVGALAATPIRDTPAEAWIGIGVGVSTLVLVGFIAWSTVTLAHVFRPSQAPAVDIDIFGRRWWWEAVYRGDGPSARFPVANEIHIPVGKPVRFTLTSANVIHSFWVPSLGGKTDVIPGQTNVAWLQADHPGIYRGQCGEYCGAQHAHMAFAIIADPPDGFERWRAAQVRSASAPVSDAAREGQGAFMRRCAVCHAVRGTPAGGRLGPDLTHVMSRKSLASGAIPNNPGWLSAWIADPQHIKPKSQMPNLDLSGPELASIRAYLQTLD